MGLGGLDVSNFGWGQAFGIGVGQLDTSLSFLLAVYSNDTHHSEYVLRVEPVRIPIFGIVPFSLLKATGSGGGVDLENLGAVR